MSKIGIEIEPRIVFPKDEEGNAYIGVYLNGEEVSRITVDEDTISAITTNEDSVNTVIVSKSGNTTMDIGTGEVKIEADEIKIGDTPYSIGSLDIDSYIADIIEPKIWYHKSNLNSDSDKE